MELSGDIDLCWYRAETARYQKKYLTWISSRSSTCCVFYFFYFLFVFSIIFFCFLLILFYCLFFLLSLFIVFFFILFWQRRGVILFLLRCFVLGFFWSFFEALFWVLLRFCWEYFWSCFWRYFFLFACSSWNVVSGAEGAGKKSCLQIEGWALLCTKIMAGGRVLAGQAGRKCSGWREVLLACIKMRQAAKSCWRNSRFWRPVDKYTPADGRWIPNTGCRMLYWIPISVICCPRKNPTKICARRKIWYTISNSWGRKIFLDT